MCALFQKIPKLEKKPEKKKVSEDLKDIEDIEEEIAEDLEEFSDEEEEKPAPKQEVKEESEAEEVPEPPEPVSTDSLKADLKILANRHYEIVNQLKGKSKTKEKSDLKFGGIKSNDELYREYVDVDYKVKYLVSQLIGLGVSEKEIRDLVLEAKNMDVETLI